MVRPLQYQGAGTFPLVESAVISLRLALAAATAATILGTLTPEAGRPRLLSMLNDPDQRVIPAVLASIAKLRPPPVNSTA